MKYKNFIIALCFLLLVVIGFNRYKLQEKNLEENYQVAFQEQQKERERRKLELNSNFYGKLKSGFDTSILVLGDSIALSEGATTELYWLNSLIEKIESKYNSHVWFRNLACQYMGYDAGYTQIATLDDSIDYDAVIICYPPCMDDEDLIQYEAILFQIKKKYETAAIISVMANSDRIANPECTIDLVEHYDGVYVGMQSIISESSNSLIHHEIYPNDRGYELYAEEVFAKIVDCVNDDKITSKKVSPKMESVYQYENCCYIPIQNCRKISENTVVIDLNHFNGKICIQTMWDSGRKAYDIYYDDGNWLTRNELSYEVPCWFDVFSLHDIPKADKEIMIQFSGNVNLSEIKGFYLISEDSIELE